MLGRDEGCSSNVLPAVGKVATVTIVDDESAFQFIAPTVTVEGGHAERGHHRATHRHADHAGHRDLHRDARAPRSPAPTSRRSRAPSRSPPNTPSKTFNVPIVNNTRLDGTAHASCSPSAIPTGGAQLGTQRTATLTIDDNEQAGTFKLDKGSYTVLESAGFVTINVLRSGLNLTGNVSVNLVRHRRHRARSGTNYTRPADPADLRGRRDDETGQGADPARLRGDRRRRSSRSR